MSCPKSFYIEESYHGRARVVRQGVDSQDDLQVAIETCPVDCIHWVTTPQLSLLEVALSSMKRVSVFVMLRSQKGAGACGQSFIMWGAGGEANELASFYPRPVVLSAIDGVVIIK